MDKEFQIFTTIRCDPELVHGPDQHPFYMLDFHRDRLLEAARHWNWEAAIKTLEGDSGLRNLESFLRANVPEAVVTTANVSSRAYRVKILMNQHGSLSIVKAPVAPVNVNNMFPSYLPPPTGLDWSRPQDGAIPDRLPEWEILVDKEATPRSEFTHFKTTHRTMYDEARHRAGINLADMKEVLLVNSENGSIMEGSITTPYFWRDTRWVTPPVSRKFNVAQGSGGNNGTTRRWALERKIAVEEVVPANSLVDGEECWISNGVRGFVHGKVKLQ